MFLSSFCIGQSLSKIDLLIKKEMKSDNVAVIDSGRVVHLSSNGFRDLERSIKASVNTPFHTAWELANKPTRIVADKATD